MKQYDDLNQDLQVLSKKIQLSEEEHQELLSEINRKMIKPAEKRSFLKWQYYLTTAVAAVLLAIIAIPLFQNDGDFVSGNNGGTSDTTNPPVAENPDEVTYTFNVKNNLPFDVFAMELAVYQDGKLIGSPTSAYADGSSIKQGEMFSFEFLEYDGLEMGEAILEIAIIDEPATNGGEERHKTNQISMQLSSYKEYYLEVEGDTVENITLVDYSEEYRGSQDVADITKQENEIAAMIKENLTLGLSRDDVRILFENESATGSNYYLDDFWRIDFGEHYRNPHKEKDIGDINSLKNGTLEAQLFIWWDEDDKIRWFSVLYLNKIDGKIYDYSILETGSVKHIMVTE